MNDNTYKYGCGDFWARFVTTLIITVLVLGIAALFYFHGVMYISVWVSVVSAVLISLFVLSVPRRLIFEDDLLELKCVLESSFLPYDKIWLVEEGSLRGKICVCGSFGFFGYYGFYLDLRCFSSGRKMITRVYAKRKDDLVEIVCGGKRYLVGCAEREELIFELRRRADIK